MKKTISILCLSAISLFSCHAQEKTNVVYKSKDMQVFSAYIRNFYAYKDESIGELIIKTGQFFLGQPYIASTLEIPDQEELIVNLTEFDCTTLIETCFALSLMLKDDNFDIGRDMTNNFDLFCQKLKKIRYRNGKIDGYASRLHYFSDWIFCNEKKGLIYDISKTIGGEKKYIEVSFMSTHPDSYKQLKENPSLIKTIQETENTINQRTYYYIPKSKIKNIQSGIQNGDIIAFATSINGLDISHTGFAICENDTLHLLHASLTEKKVVISTQTLSAYTENVKRYTGIMVARPSIN